MYRYGCVQSLCSSCGSYLCLSCNSCSPWIFCHLLMTAGGLVRFYDFTLFSFSTIWGTGGLLVQSTTWLKLLKLPSLCFLRKTNLSSLLLWGRELVNQGWGRLRNDLLIHAGQSLLRCPRWWGGNPEDGSVRQDNWSLSGSAAQAITGWEVFGWTLKGSNTSRPEIWPGWSLIVVTFHLTCEHSCGKVSFSPGCTSEVLCRWCDVTRSSRVMEQRAIILWRKLSAFPVHPKWHCA